MLHARPGFNVIATANIRDRGVHEMSSALKRRFNFETVHPIRELGSRSSWSFANATGCWGNRTSSCRSIDR